jgi:hypothetical protein
MSRKVKVTEETGGEGEIKLLVASDTTDIDGLTAEERKNAGKGFTAGGTFRKIANIPTDDFNALLALGDKNALDYAASDYKDNRAIRKLLRLHPEWRSSEGDI